MLTKEKQLSVEEICSKTQLDKYKDQNIEYKFAKALT